MDPATIPLPPALAVPRATPFVGREAAVGRVLDAYATAVQGCRRAVLVAGEPGIGKSRLLAEAAQRLHAAGAVVLYGRCDEEALVAYQPLIEALRHFALHTSPDVLRGALGADAGELTRLLPDLQEVLGASEARGGERYRLFETVSTLVGAVSRVTPVVLVLEDLQWVDTASALLVRHLFRHPQPGAVLVLASYRDNEILPGHPFAVALSDLRLPEFGERIRLDGLGQDDVAAILGATVGPAAHDLARSLQEQTEGNPFFVEEVARQLAETAWRGTLVWEELGVPEGIREALSRRLAKLRPETVRLLEQAAVVGRAFQLPVVAEAARLSADDGLDAVEEAVSAGLLRESSGRFAFTHDLVRQTLYETLSLVRRVRSHKAVGEALEDSGADVAELAHHFLRGTLSGEDGKAVDYSSAAARQALDRLAYEEAAELWSRALEVVEDERSPMRAEPLLGLGEARRRAGDTNGARAAFLEASALARELRDHDLLGRAALGYGQGSGGLHRMVRCDETHIALLEEALHNLGDVDSALRVRLLARLAEELYFTPQSTRRAELTEEAVARAERVGDPAVLLSARYVQELIRVGPAVPPRERTRSTGEIIALARELGDLETAYLGHLLRELAFVEAGDLAAAVVELDAAEQLADDLRMPSLQAWVLGARSRQAWITGDLPLADVLNAQATARSMELGGDPEVAGLVLGGQALAHQILRSDLSDFVAPLEAFRDAYPNLPILRGFLAYAYAMTGKLDLAQAELDGLAGDAFDDVPRTVEWPGIVWSCALTTYLLDDKPRAEVIYELARPLAGRWFADWASVCVGPADTALGLLCLVRGDEQRAVEHLESAVSAAALLPSPPWLADAQLHLATALEPSDPKRAEVLRKAARATAHEHGLEALLG